VGQSDISQNNRLHIPPTPEIFGLPLIAKERLKSWLLIAKKRPKSWPLIAKKGQTSWPLRL